MDEHTAIQIYEWYSDIERRLLDVVKVLPFVKKSDLESIRSPRLTSILLEAASLVDTLFRNRMPQSFTRAEKKRKVSKENANIKDYYRVIEPQLKLSESKSLLLKGAPTLLSPFSPWGKNNSSQIEWWRAYNKIKHDRLVAADKISMSHCLEELCGLNQLMLKLPV